MIIALDLDGVCYEWEKTARYMLRRKLTQERRPIPTELFAPSRHFDAIQEAVEPADWEWLWHDGVDLGLFRYGHCVTGAIEGVEALGELGTVKIVTARPRSARKDTYDWVSHYFNRAAIGDLIFTKDKHEVDANVYIDDAAHQARELHGMGKNVVVLQRPWNRELPHDVGLQVPNWTGIVDTVRSLLP